MAKQKTISRDIPLAEITLRRYEKPSALTERELIRKMCLSIGLLQPGDSRDVVVDVLAVLIRAKKEKKIIQATRSASWLLKKEKTTNYRCLELQHPT